MKSIRLDKAAYDALSGASAKWPRADELWDVLDWNLALDPTVGRPLTERGDVRAYTIDGAISVGWPTVTVLYKIEGDYITILDARFTKARRTAQAGRA